MAEPHHNPFASPSQKVVALRFSVSAPYLARTVARQKDRIQEAQARYCSAAVAQSADFEEQGRLINAQFSAIGNIEADTHFMLVTINTLRRLGKKLRKLTGDHRVAQAEAAFEAVAFPGKRMRDVVEHIEEYMIGDGSLQRDGAVPRAVNRPLIELRSTEPSEEIDYVFDGDRLEVKATADAAVAFARVLDQVASDFSERHAQ